MEYSYYMIYRPAMPGAMPKAGLENIESLDPRTIIPAIGRGAYSIVTYNRELSPAEVRDYELVPLVIPTPVQCNGYTIRYSPVQRVWEACEVDSPVAWFDTIEEAIEAVSCA